MYFLVFFLIRVGFGYSVLCFYVEGIADAVAKEHKGEDENHNGQSRQEGEVGTVE